MTNIGSVSSTDTLLERMKSSRKNPAVLKLSLALLRQKFPNGAIFAFEGIDDKAVYLKWIRRITPNLSFEPFPCGGKKYVLSLRSMLHRDLTNLGQHVFFFIDRDYDDLCGHPTGDELFLTDRYSIENYLVTASVVDETLKDELHFHGEPEARRAVVDIFERLYAEFLAASRDLNFRLYCSKRLGIQLEGSLPDKPQKIAEITFRRVAVATPRPEDCIRLVRDPSEQEMQEMRREFDALPPEKRYRGKFAMMFLMAWLRVVAEKRVSRDEGPLGQLSKVSRTNISEVTLGNLAAKSSFPDGLGNFLIAVENAVVA